jgi:hypothetical protein
VVSKNRQRVVNLTVFSNNPTAALFNPSEYCFWSTSLIAASFTYINRKLLSGCLVCGWGISILYTPDTISVSLAVAATVNICVIVPKETVPCVCCTARRSRPPATVASDA